jgi:hypothetical protein
MGLVRKDVFRLVARKIEDAEQALALAFRSGFTCESENLIAFHFDEMDFTA